MNFSNFYIKAVIEKLELETYTEASKLIGGSSGTMTDIKKEIRTITHKQAIEISKILEIDEGVILAGMMVDKAKTEQEKSAWKKLILGYKNLPHLAGLELILCKIAVHPIVGKLFQIKSKKSKFVPFGASTDGSTLEKCRPQVI